MLEPAPPTADLDAWTELGAHLRRGGFDAEHVTQAMGLDGWDRETADLLYWELPVKAPKPLAVWTRCLLQAHPVRVSELDRTLPRAAGTVGLLEQKGPQVRCRYSLVPLAGGDLALSDRPAAATNDPDSVFLPDSSTLAMRRSLPRTPVRRHLDVGCGSGAVALRAARHAEETVLIDVNPRACELARASFALSGQPIPRAYVGTIQDAPMAGPFDRVSFVMPLLVPWEGMVAAPVHTMSDHPDLLVQTLETLPGLLAEGGLALLYCQEHTPDTTAEAVLDEAFGDRPWCGGMWWEDEEPDLDGVMTRVGILAVQADHSGGWRCMRNIEDDGPDTWWWPALQRDLELG